MAESKIEKQWDNLFTESIIESSSCPGPFSIVEYKVIDAQSVAVNGACVKSIEITKPGWYPLGVVGWRQSGTNTSYINLYKLMLDEQDTGYAKLYASIKSFIHATTPKMGLSNTTMTLTLYAEVLWAKEIYR